MGVKQQAPVRGNLAGERCGIGLVTEYNAGGNAEGHDAFLHLESRNKELPVVKAAPLQIEVGAPRYGMIAEADEVEAGAFHGEQDVLEGHFAVVRVLGMAVQDSPILVPAGVISYSLALSPEALPRGFLPREADEAVV